MTETQISPLPWREGGWANEGICAFRIIAANHVIIADILWHPTNKLIAPSKETALLNARFIVRCVNDSASEIERGRKKCPHCGQEMGETVEAMK